MVLRSATPMSNVFTDIETQRTDDPAVIRRLQEAVKPPGQYKKADSIAQWWATEGAAARVEAVNRTALDGTYGRLATIGYAFDEDEPTILTTQFVDESTILQEFSLAMTPVMGQSFTLVAFNGEFDFRFLMKRYVINNIRVPFMIQRALARDGYFDPMKAWEGFKGYISQAELEKVLGISRNDDIDGSQVGEALDAGDWDRVIRHNREDIQGLRAIYRKLTL